MSAKTSGNYQPSADKNFTIISSQIIYIFLIIVLFFCNIVFVYLWYKHSQISKQFHEAEKYSLVDFSRNFIESKHFFSTINPVRDGMKELVEKYEAEGHEIGVYFEFLNTGANVSINQDKRFWPASLSKMPTVFAVMKKIENDEWKLNNELVLFAEDQDSRFGELYRKTPGTRLTIEELIKETLISSDNTAHKILVRNLSSDDYTKIFEALGMEDLFNKDYNITAKEYSRIFRALYTSSYLSRENSQMLLRWLTQTNFNHLLGAGLPEDIIFSHKIGEEYNESVFLDSGIFYVPNRPCLITVMIKVKPEGSVDDAKKIMSELSKIAYEYVAQK